MSADYEKFGVQERSAIGAAINIEFECSFAAAEANEAAFQLLQTREYHIEEARSRKGYGDNDRRLEEHEEFIQIIGDPYGLRKCEVIEREGFGCSGEQPGGSLALIQPIDETQRKVMSRVLRRHVKTEVEETREMPMLVAMYDDVALPLATFARRKDGNCSYVQIGSEIKDDNFHVLASDDRTGRNVIIEAIREALDPKHSAWIDRGRYDIASRVGIQTQQAIDKLVRIEYGQNKDLLDKSFEAQLVRKLVAQLDPAIWRRLILISEKGLEHDGRFSISTLIGDTPLPDNRKASLIVANPMDGKDQDMAYIMALTRAQVASPVATLNISTGEILFDSSQIQKNAAKRKEVVFKFLSLLRGEPRLIDELHARRDVLQLFETQERLSVLGSTSPEEEDLTEAIFNMRCKSNIWQGVIEDVDLGSTAADILFRVEISCEGTQNQVVVKGKPAAMKDEELKLLPTFCFSYDVTKTIHEQLNGTKDHVAMLISTFARLNPVTVRQTQK